MIAKKSTLRSVPTSARRRQGYPMRLFLLATLVALCLIIAVASTLLSGTAQQVALGTTNVFAPALRAVSSTSEYVERTLRNANAMLNAEGTVAQLETQEARARFWQNRAHKLELENAELRRQLGVTGTPDHPFVTARVIGGPTGPFGHSVIIDAGAVDGVLGGSTVTSARNLVGRVIGVGEGASRVLLLSDPNSRVPVRVGPEGTRAILTGDGTDNPVLELPSNREQLVDGARVVTSGTGGVFARDILVGHVELSGKRVRLQAGQGDRLNFIRILLPAAPEFIPDPELIVPGLNAATPEETTGSEAGRAQSGDALGARATGVPARRAVQ